MKYLLNKLYDLRLKFLKINRMFIPYITLIVFSGNYFEFFVPNL